MKPYLYLLPFKDNKHFKFGISLTDNLNRVVQHHKTYGIKENKSIIFESNNKENIRLLERNIKVMISQILTEDFIYDGTDGYTEIRNMNQWGETMGIIDMFMDRLELKKRKLKLPKGAIKDNRRKQLKKKSTNHTTVNNNILVLSTMESTINHMKKNIISIKDDGDYVNLYMDISNKHESFDMFKKIISGSFEFGGLTFNVGSHWESGGGMAKLSFYNRFPKHNKDGQHEGYDELGKSYNRFVNELVREFNKPQTVYIDRVIEQPREHHYHTYMKNGGGK